MKVSGVVNEAALVYFVIKQMSITRKTSVIVIKDDIDVSIVSDTARVIKDIFDFDFLVCEYDALLENRTRVSKRINDNLPLLIVSSLKSVNEPVLTDKALFSTQIQVGDFFERKKLENELFAKGFKKTNFVEMPGEFAVRGSVVDVFNYGEEYPFRIFFDDKKIESIKRFEIDSQNTFDFINSFFLVDVNGDKKYLWDFDFEFFAYDVSFEKNCNYLSSFDTSGKQFSFENIVFSSNDVFFSEIKRFQDNDFLIHIFVLNERESIKISSIIDEGGLSFKNIFFHQGYIRKGFYSPLSKVCVISSNEIFRREYVPTKRITKKTLNINHLQKGDYVVHQDYGIGIYNGITDYTHRDEWGNLYTSQVIEIIYAGGDKLYVALDDFKKIEKYIGDPDKVKISSLSSERWRNIKERIRKEVEKIAYQIIKLEAMRKVVKIKPMIKTDMEDDFVSDFPYEETEDQKRAIDDVLKDLESHTPANRLIVGDVGFGKTEVAMRAAFRAVSNGYQVCVLCPTTILAEQHYRTFLKRFERFPFNIAKISRFLKPYEESKIKKDVERGVVDIVIGTHKLLSDDVKFKNLGLLIIDEEHKFGVKQKDIIKNRYYSVHVIYLSATPIPRTLYQSLSNLRDMSIIETPPLGRLPIETVVCPYSDNIVIDAVNNEIKRGGQIFYVYNRVEFIDIKFEKLRKLFPGLSICVVHGQMKGEEIDKVMMDFIDKKYLMMLSSTIIESGIDIPTVNTLIVEDAHKFGLAQLYQLRGRIGREKTKAYCYFMYPPYLEKEVNEGDISSKDAVKRLLALEEFTELGSGFRLSMRDLEIRGAGEILGTRQHGFITAVGLETYIRLLNDEISRIKGREIREEKEVLIDIGVSAFIPPEYINDDMERLIFYKRLANSKYDDIDNIVRDMEDLAGKMPLEVKNLIRIVKIKKALSGKGISKIIEKGGAIEFYFEKNFISQEFELERWLNIFKGRINFFKTSTFDGFSVRIDKNIDKISVISDAFGLNI